MSDLVGDAVRLIDELDCEPVMWVGLSMGGMIGQGLAIAHPERVERLVLANTTSHYPDEARQLWAERARVARADGMQALAALIMSRYFSPMFLASRPDIVETFRQDVLGVDPLGYAACCEAIGSLDYHAALGGIVCPTLVIAGGADAAAAPGMPQGIAERIPGASLAVMETAGHLSAVEQPEEFVRLLRAVL
jgi:3-oxoadipate enol-lactonase